MTESFENLRRIPDGAFMGREDLHTLILPEGVEVIGEGAFMHCSSLRSVQLPASVGKIGAMAFFGCTSLTRAWVENRDCQIGAYAFGGFFEDLSQRDVTMNWFGASGESALLEGHFPPRFPLAATAPEKLMYALLWCKETEKLPHNQAASYLKTEIDSAFSYILRTRRKDLWEALLLENRIPSNRFPSFIQSANEMDQPELAGLLLHYAARPRASLDFDEEFSL